ncbi:hypothetical protein KY284_027414 [Solanum tuberosum]|nr:hypothetical protein KY284_027414 [Solanum tuberosum]
MEGIIYEYSSLYSGLVSAITSQLMIDANIHNIEIKYIVSDRCPPISIHNDVDNQDSVVVVDRKHSDVSRTLTNFDLYSSNSIRLIGVNLDGVVDENTDEGNGVISDLSNLFIAENQIYNDKETLMEVMRHYGVVEKFRFIVTRSSSSCYYLKCPADNCSWMMNSSCLNQSKLFKIRKYCAEHTCSVRDRVYARRQGITDVVAVLIMDKFIDPSIVYTPKDIAEDVLKVHGVALTYMQAWRAKEKAIKLVRGDPAESYAKLPEACIRGWEYCRPIVVVDGAALRGAYGGTMLTASTMDPGVQRWIHKHNEEAAKTRSALTKKYDLVLHKSIALSSSMRVIPSTVDMHAVVDGPKRYIVNLNTKMCSCGRFQNDEIPCGHGIAVLRYKRLHETDYCSPFYSLKNFQDTYAIPVEPLPCESTWDIPSYVSEPKLMPPGPKRAAGRPQLERWKGFADVKFKRSKVTCSRCRQVGHNMTTCSNYPVQKI